MWQLVLTWLKGVLIVVIAGFCFFAAGHHGAWHNFATSFTGAKGGFSGFMIAMIAALWAYDGWSDVSQMAGEVKNPQRSLPLALIGGVVIVGVLYMLTNAAIQYVLPAASIAMADRPTVDAMRIVAGNWGAGAGDDWDVGEHGGDVCGVVTVGCKSDVCGGTRWTLLSRVGACASAVQDA